MFAALLSIFRRMFTEQQDGWETKKGSRVCSTEVKVNIQSPNRFFIFSNHINSRVTVSSSKYRTKLTAGNEIKH